MLCPEPGAALQRSSRGHIATGRPTGSTETPTRDLPVSQRCGGDIVFCIPCGGCPLPRRDPVTTGRGQCGPQTSWRLSPANSRPLDGVMCPGGGGGGSPQPPCDPATTWRPTNGAEAFLRDLAASLPCGGNVRQCLVPQPMREARLQRDGSGAAY